MTVSAEPQFLQQQLRELELRLKQLDAERADVLQAIENLKAEEQLEAKLLEGLNSKERAMTAADWKALRAEALAKLATRKCPR